MDDYVDVETFVHEIEKRRALWDKSSEEYRDKIVRRQLWSEVYAACYPGFEEMDAQQQTDISKELQAKWKHLRDCYVRYLRNTRTNSGRGRKLVRRYIFAPYLDFLKDVINTPRAASIPIQPGLPEKECYEVEIEDNDVSASSTENQEDTERTNKQTELKNRIQQSLNTFYKRRRKNFMKYTTTDIDSEDENIITTHNKTDSSSDDMDFFRSLLPFVKSLPLQQKINFRTDVMKIAKQYAENSDKPRAPSLESSSFSPFTNSSLSAPFYLPVLPVQPFPMQSLNTCQKLSFENPSNIQNAPPSNNPNATSSSS